MRYRTDLSMVRGAGAAKDGTRHWWAQRLTAVALVPLGIGFVVMTIALLGSDYDGARSALAHPVAAALWILFAVALFHHAQLGLQVVLEDYVRSHALKVATIVAGQVRGGSLGRDQHRLHRSHLRRELVQDARRPIPLPNTPATWWSWAPAAPDSAPPSGSPPAASPPRASPRSFPPAATPWRRKAA